MDTLPYYFGTRISLPASTSRAGGFPAVGLLVDLLPVGLLVGEVVAGLAAILLHASKLITFRDVVLADAQRE